MKQSPKWCIRNGVFIGLIAYKDTVCDLFEGIHPYGVSNKGGENTYFRLVSIVVHVLIINNLRNSGYAFNQRSTRIYIS